MVATHETIRKYRNSKVAHSQSDLVMPLPVATSDDAGRVLRVWGTTITHQMPSVIAERFAHLLMTMETIVEEVTQSVAERLYMWAQTQTPEAIHRWRGPEITDSIDDDFNAARDRKRSPRFTTYFSLALQPVDGRPLRGRLLGPGRTVAELRTPEPGVSTTFSGCCPYVVTGLSASAIVGSRLPRGGGYGLVAVAGRLVRDGFEGLAARHPAMTRPLIERRDMIAG